jgi:hypothetical protein
MTTLTAEKQKELADAFASAKSGPATARQNSPFPKPTLKQAVNDVLDPWLAEPSGVQVEVTYDPMLTSDLIALSFNGDESYELLSGSAFKKVTFTVPAAAIAASVGKTVPVMYAVSRPNGTNVSDSLNLQVTPIAQTRLPTPAITQAAGNVLDSTTFTGIANLVVGKWPLAVVGQRVWLTVSGPGGVPSYKLLEGYPINVQEVGAGIARDIPRAELEKFADGSQLTVTCKVAFDGANTEPLAIAFPIVAYTIKAVEPRLFEGFDGLSVGGMKLAAGQSAEFPTMTVSVQSGVVVANSADFPPHWKPWITGGNLFPMSNFAYVYKLTLKLSVRRIRLAIRTRGRGATMSFHDENGIQLYSEPLVYADPYARWYEYACEPGKKLKTITFSGPENSPQHIDNITLTG